jgi:signal transduction histidine kinase
MRLVAFALFAVLGVGIFSSLGADAPVGVGASLSATGFTSEAALTNQPVQSSIRGTVTWVDADRNLLVLQDGTRAMALRADIFSTNFSPGDRVVLEGKLSRMLTAFSNYPDRPDGQEILPTCEGPTNFGQYYLTRLRGFLHPPVTGNYTFWIASDDSSELWLSQNADPSGARKISTVESGHWTDARQWTRFPSQQSQTISLQAGEDYFIEAVSQQSWGKDCLAVAWRGPQNPQGVIDGQYLSPWNRDGKDSSRSAATKGILREYWRNFFPADLSVLRVWDESILNLDHVKIIERQKMELPDPMPLEAGQPLKLEDNFRFVETTGQLAFFGRRNGFTELELAAGSSHLHIRFKGELEAPPENSFVHVRGVCEAVRDAENNLVADKIWVANPDDVTWADVEKNWSRVQPMAMYSLSPSNPDLASGRSIAVRGRVVGQESPGGWIIQGDDVFQGYTSANGTNWNPLGTPVELAMNDPVLAGIAVSSRNSDQAAELTVDHVSGLSTNLIGADIGKPYLSGDFTFNADSLKVRGAGSDIWGMSDQFYFAHQAFNGDGEIIAHVTGYESVDTSAKAGLMFRESLDNQSPWAAMLVTPMKRTGLQTRREAGKNSGGTLLDQQAQWLKLTRHRQSLLVRTDEGESPPPNQTLNIIGSLSWENGHPVLTGAHFHRVTGQVVAHIPVSNPSAREGDLRDVSIADITPLADQLQQAGSSVHFRIRGVVTFNAEVSHQPLVFLQDASGGCLVRFGSGLTKGQLPFGHLVELSGGQVSTNVTQEFMANGIADFGDGSLPDAAWLSSGQSGTKGASLGRWTETTGVIRSVGKSGTLLLMTQDGPLLVWTPPNMAGNPLTNYVNALVRVRGVYWQLPAPAVLAPSSNFIDVVETPPQDPFSIPSFAVGTIDGLKIPPQSAHRVKAVGVVTCVRDGFFVLQDESGGMRVEGKIPAEIKVGDKVEAAGFPEHKIDGLMMTETLVRKMGAGKHFQPEEVSVNDAPDEQKNRLVTLEAKLLEFHVWDGMQTLDLQSGQRAFRALLPESAGRLPSIANGSRLRLTGVNQIETVPAENSGGGRPIAASMELLLRDPGDVEMLERPPWWNWKYTAAAVTFFGAVLAGSLIWIRTLRRRVEERTQALRETMDKLQKETQISATLAERNRLAGEIHDSVEQGLSAIMMQMDAATGLIHQPDEIKRFLGMARDMASFSREEVHHAVWNMHSPLLENANLGTAFQRVIHDINAGGPAMATVQISGEAYSLPSSVEHHLLRIGQEAITNAVKHSRAKTIHLNLDYGKLEVTLTIRDDGCGFDPQAVNLHGGHFGLQGMQDRALKMNATLNVTSKPGTGTTISVIVPLEKETQNF